MFAGLVENLGLKEGLAEFKEQFKTDAKSTIAETQFAKDRGIDVAKLDAWEQEVQEKTEAAAGELHNRTIGLAVETIAKEETLAKLLDIKAGEAEGGEDDGGGDCGDVGEDEGAEGGVEAAGAVRSDGDGGGSVLSEASSAWSASAVGASPAAAPSSSSAAPAPAPGGSDTAAGMAAAATGTAAATAAARPAPQGRISRLAEEVRLKRNDLDAVEALLVSSRAESATLQARWTEMAGLSSDASQQAAEAERQVEALRRALEARDAEVTQAVDERERVDTARHLARRRKEELEVAFQERLAREVSQKEQELLDEVAYLRSAQELRENKINELTSDKEALERKAGSSTVAAARAAVAARAPEGSTGATQLEAHIALARAAGYIEAGTPEENPLWATLDGPSLRFSAALLKRPLLRRAFFACSALAWLTAALHALNPGQGHVILT